MKGIFDKMWALRTRKLNKQKALPWRAVDHPEDVGQPYGPLAAGCRESECRMGEVNKEK